MTTSGNKMLVKYEYDQIMGFLIDTNYIDVCRTLLLVNWSHEF
jgi:hypothetical protein